MQASRVCDKKKKTPYLFFKMFSNWGINSAHEFPHLEDTSLNTRLCERIVVLDLINESPKAPETIRLCIQHEISSALAHIWAILSSIVTRDVVTPSLTCRSISTPFTRT